jgi:hypothetical protein
MMSETGAVSGAGGRGSCESFCRHAATVFCALQVHKQVAGGNAPGKRDAHSSTLKGSYYPGRGMQDRRRSPGFGPFRVESCWERIFRGR